MATKNPHSRPRKQMLLIQKTDVTRHPGTKVAWLVRPRLAKNST
jgi:hypothetical protein